MMLLGNVVLLFCIVATIHSSVLPSNENTVCENGKSQSPISVNLYQTDYVAYPPFVFSDGYRQPMVFQVLKHEGVTISIAPIFVAPRTLTVSGGCLSGVFTFEIAHLHWPQSEHRITNNNYVAEAHFIHKNLDTNETAVFAYFFTLAKSQTQENGVEINSWEHVLQRFTNNINMTIEGGLSSLMKGNKDRFVHYTGSLTTSPCTEGILWILVSSAIELRESTLNRLQTNIVTSNDRATQPLNGRSVQRSFLSTSWNI